MSPFSFSFSGDDIEDLDAPGKYDSSNLYSLTSSHGDMETKFTEEKSTSAFPIPGQRGLRPQVLCLDAMLASLPSKIAYNSLKITLENGSDILIPRRELWDLRVQLIAEDDEQGLKNLGKNDVKTGVYEGGFKSWESSGDLVKVLYQRREASNQGARKILELGCGTALPSVFEFQQQFLKAPNSLAALSMGLADYNPTVLRLVTLPNLILAWALFHGRLLDFEGDLEIDEQLIDEFLVSLRSYQINLSFFSGSWSAEFINLVEKEMTLNATQFIIIGAETIYSPYSLKAFAETLLGFLKPSSNAQKIALVAAKRVYFGIGGTIMDFSKFIEDNGGNVKLIYEVTEGVRRAVVEVQVPSK